jgi:hypothetical protein
MSDKYFVMLNWQNGEGASPMVDDEGKPVFYEHIDDARCDADENAMGNAFGYEIFCLGTGES